MFQIRVETLIFHLSQMEYKITFKVSQNLGTLLSFTKESQENSTACKITCSSNPEIQSETFSLFKVKSIIKVWICNIENIGVNLKKN